MKSSSGDTGKNSAFVKNYITGLANGIYLKSKQKADNGSGITPDKLSDEIFQEIAESMGLKAKIISGDWSTLCHRDLPSVVKYHDGHILFVIKANIDSVLLYDQSEGKTSIVSKDLFLSRWSGYAVTFQA